MVWKKIEIYLWFGKKKIEKANDLVRRTQKNANGLVKKKDTIILVK